MRVVLFGSVGMSINGLDWLDYYAVVTKPIRPAKLILFKLLWSPSGDLQQLIKLTLYQLSYDNKSNNYNYCF